MKVYGTLEFADLENLASDPSHPTPGRIWYNTTDKKLKYYNGAVVTFSTSISGESSYAHSSGEYDLGNVLNEGITLVIASGSGTTVKLPDPLAKLDSVKKIKRNDATNQIVITRTY